MPSHQGPITDLLQVQGFKYNLEGDLTQEAMQADQVRVEFKTARSNFFAARTLYYQSPSFRQGPVRYLDEQGKPASVPFVLEPLDALPKENPQPTEKRPKK